MMCWSPIKLSTRPLDLQSSIFRLHVSNKGCCQINENSHQIAVTAETYALNN